LSVVTRITTCEEITLPFASDEVWSVLTEIGAYPRWWPTRLGVRILNDPPGLLGAEFEVRPWLGRTHCVRIEELEGTHTIRLRFFGGAFEGPGGFHLHRGRGVTKVRYEIDVFTRGLDIAAISHLLPMEWLHKFRMRTVLWSLKRRLTRWRRAAPAAVRAPEAAIAFLYDAPPPSPVEERAAPPVGAIPVPAVVETHPGTPLESPVARAIETREAEPPVSLERPAPEKSFLGRISAWLMESPEWPRKPWAEAERSHDHEETRRIEGVAPAAAVTPDDAIPPAEAEPQGSDFEIARTYLKALSSDAPPDDIARFFDPEATDEEFPHRFLAETTLRDLSGIREARGKELARFESFAYELQGATGGGSQVAIEVSWKGRVRADGDGFSASQALEARLALFLRFREGRIVRRRVYTCFEPWSTEEERSIVLAERSAAAGPVSSADLSGPRGGGAVPSSNFDLARNYLDALSEGKGPEEIAAFYAGDATQEEFPNRLRPNGAVRNLDLIKQARSRGLALLSSEQYDLRGATGFGSQVAMEVQWTGTVSKTTGAFVTGQKLDARFALFLKFRDGLIVRQRNYDCV
jgi:ketosteroid isomerase-like protein